MINATLKSPDDSVSSIANVFDRGNMSAYLEVQEDQCFKSNNWLRVGTIRLHPAAAEPQDPESPLEQAVRLGAYSWQLPSFDEMTANANAAFLDCPKKRTDKQEAVHNDKTRRALEAIINCASRCGFVHPTFDAGSVRQMPFARPTTVVVDTTAILQGGLDFVVRFLYPMARIKIPAIAHMEVLNMADRYMSQRRAGALETRVAGAFYDHITGQAGQRVLLRLELQTEAEIERPRLGADPLRGVVQPDHDAEDRALGLMQVVRSFADRLILETAIHHRDQLSPDHPIVLLTADQGLARMTLGEGIVSLFFSSPSARSVCGRVLTGTTFRPFVTENGDSPLFPISLTSLLWELAASVGSARIVTEDQTTAFSVYAMGDQWTWHPYHSHDDLLWTASDGTTGPSKQEVRKTPPDGHSDQRPKNSTCSDERPELVSVAAIKSPNQKNSLDTRPVSKELRGAYRFSVSAMVVLALQFERRDRLTDREGMRIVGIETAKRYQDFRNFLIAGGFAERVEHGLRRLPAIDELLHAIRKGDRSGLYSALMHVPSFSAFINELSVGKAIPVGSVSSISGTAVRTYVRLAEISCAAVEVFGEGIYHTPNSPLPQDFARIALAAYRQLKGGEDYVLTGQWLEELVRHHGIHPLRARERLNEARAAGLIERYTEGSTPETQFERHSISVLELIGGAPSVREMNLYHGDFLIPGKASVSMRLEEAKI